MAGENGSLGPISYLIVEFPGSKMTGEGLPALIDLVERGVIRILDLGLRRQGPGRLTRDHRPRGSGPRRHDRPRRLRGHLFGTGEPRKPVDAAPVIAPGSSAAILIFENRWATPLYPGVAARARPTRCRRLHPPRPTSWPRSTRPDGWKGDRPCGFLGGSRAPLRSPALPLPCRTTVSRRQQNRWAQQEDQQYAPQQPQATPPPPPPRTGEGPGRAAQGSCRAQITRDPQRRRVRRSEGEDPGVLNTGRRQPPPLLRGSADRREVWHPAVAPVDELCGDQEDDDECQLGESVLGLAIGVPPHLAIVREPGVRPLHRPTQPHRVPLRSSASARCLPLCDHRIPDLVCREALACDGGVVAAVEPERFDLGEVAAACRSPRVGESTTESLRLAPSATHPIGMP